MRGELGTLIDIELTGPLFSLSGTHLLSVFYINEVLMRLLHKHEPHPELFAAYDLTLMGLNTGQSEDALLRVFEKKLLDELGYGLILDHDVKTGEPVLAELNYYYQAVQGPSTEKLENEQTIPVSGETLIALQTDRIDSPTVLKEAKQLMRLALRPHLGDKPLASRELYKAYIQQLKGA